MPVVTVFAEDAPPTNLGSPGFNPDSACFHSSYPEMPIWARAGVNGGIPNITNIKARLNPGDNIQRAIDSGGVGVVYLRNGTYRIDNSLRMRDGVIVRGEQRNGVKLSVRMRGGEAIEFSDSVDRAGLENLTVAYEEIGSPPRIHRNGFNDGGFCRECFENDRPGFDNSLIRIDGDNNWVDNVSALNSGSDPVEIYGNNNTFRNSLVENTHNRGGGGEGYFDLRGNNNLVTGSTVRLIRHFAIQQKARNNVIVKNRIEGDVNFHNKDDGHNLVEDNVIIRPSWHTWGVFATGGARFGHTRPGPRNVIVNNTTFDHRENRTEFSSRNVVYTYRDYGEPDSTNWPISRCGKLYAVRSAGDPPVNPPVNPPRPPEPPQPPQPPEPPQPPVADGPCWVTKQTLSQAISAYNRSCSVPRKDCDAGREGWVCASVKLTGGNFPSNPPADSDDPQPPPRPPEPPQPPSGGTIGKVDANDLVSLHYDNCPDRDDGHAIAAGKAVVVRSGLPNVMVVNGTCGDRIRDRYQPSSERVISVAWGNQWLDYFNDGQQSVRTAVQRWAQVLSNGGDVWVAEGGPADFTARVLESLESQFPSLNLKKVHVVQHSAGNAFNENHSIRIGLVKRLANYRVIPNGNRGGNGSANLNKKSSFFVGAARQSQFANEWNAAFEYLDPDQRLDFSDTVELLFLINDDSTKTVDDFARRYLR